MQARAITLAGAGRVAASMAAYWRALGHHVLVLDRAALSDPVRRVAAFGGADVVALAVPDRFLVEFSALVGREAPGAEIIHFAAASLIDGAWSYHPLYSFPKTALDPGVTGAVTIARQEGAAEFACVIPGVSNPEIVLKDADRAYYHALAVVSGNLAAYLWNRTAEAAAARLGVEPAGLYAPYFEGLVARFAETPTDSLTGPVARRDAATVEANLAALADEPKLRALYEAFLTSAWPDFPD